MLAGDPTLLSSFPARSYQVRTDCDTVDDGFITTVPPAETANAPKYEAG
jgi:hypothetical protein